MCDTILSNSCNPFKIPFKSDSDVLPVQVMETLEMVQNLQKIDPNS